MKSSLRLGKVFGIPIGINYTWFIVFALVTLSLATGYFPSRYADWSLAGYLSLGLLTSVLFFASVLLHELAHSIVARAWGIPVQSITLFIFGGVANISREPERPLAEFLVAIAGPIASLLLALLFGLLWLTGRLLDLPPLAALGYYLSNINLGLALFNLIPGFPLDGGRVFRSLVWAATGDLYRATRWATRTGRIFAVVMIVGGGFMILTGNLGGGVWLAFIGWFLDNAASQSAQQAWLREALRGYTAGDFSSACQMVDGNTPLDWLVRDYVLPHGQRCFVITDGLRPQGIADLEQIQQVPRGRWGWTPVRQIMTPLHQIKPIQSAEPAYSALERMVSERRSALPVVDGNRLLGLVRQDHLLRFAQMQSSAR